MTLRLCVLASGSSGNCTYVCSDRTEILIDAGLSGRQVMARLKAAGVGPALIRAICVTHEHADHKAGLAVLHRRTGALLYGNTATIDAIERSGGNGAGGLTWNIFQTNVPFEIGDLKVEPFSVSHDAYDPVGFVVSAGDCRAGIVTDIGAPTNVVRESLRNCETVVIEANHDEALLRDAPRPWSLRQRIAGRQGHLSNAQTGQLVAEIAGPALRTVFLAHLSAECNRPELALRAVSDALAKRGCGHVRVKLTYPDRPSDWSDQ